MTSPIRVLVTCAGSGVAQSVVDSLRHDKDAFTIFTSDQERYQYSVPDCDGIVSLPSVFDPGYVDAVCKACEEHRIEVLVPGHDAELEPFSLAKDRFAEHGTKVAVSDPKLVGLLRNKLDWARQFRQSSDVVVLSHSVAEVRSAEAQLEFPMIAKPSGGSASSGLHILHSAADAEGLPDDLVVQTFLYPPADSAEYTAVSRAVEDGRILQVSEVSVQLVYSYEGELLGRFASMNRLKGGVPIEVIPIDDKDIWAAIAEIEKILAEFQPCGPINIQGRITDSGVVFFEMNPRFTGITGNRSQFGFNEVQAVCRNLARGETGQLSINPNKVGVRQVACRTWNAHDFAFPATSVSPKRLVLLGGTSWLGRCFIRTCQDRDVEVGVLSRPESLEAAADAFADFDDVKVVGTNSLDASNLMGWGDALINLAAARPPAGADAIRDSHAFQMRWLTQAAISQVPFILNISSQSVYRQVPGEWTEEGELETSTPYSFSKFAIETHLENLRRVCPEIRAVSLRLARLFGAAGGMRMSEFPHLFADKARTGGEIVIDSNASAMDLLDIRDAVSALWFFLEQPKNHLEPVYNLGAGRATTIGKYAEVVQSTSQRHNLPGAVITTRENEDAVQEAAGFMAMDKAQALGWAPKFSLEESVEAIFRRVAR